MVYINISCLPECFQSKGGNLGDALKEVKEQIRHIPNHGIGYGILRYLGSEWNKSSS